MKFLSKLSKETLICSELQVKDYKEILKCSFGDEPNEQLFIEVLCDVFAKISGKPSEYFKNLNLIDLFCFLLDTRINSQGDSCGVIITKDDRKMTLELKLDHIKQELESIFNIITTTIEQDGISILFECPSAQRSLQPANEDYLYFIKGVFLKQRETNHFLEITTNEQAEQLIEKLTPKMLMKIIDQFKQFIDTLSSVNFFARYGIQNQTLSFIPSLSSLIWYTRIIFNESLETFYNNIFYLSHLGHMGAEFIENSVVGEYTYFVNQLQSVLSSKNSPQNSDEFVSDDSGFSEEPL